MRSNSTALRRTSAVLALCISAALSAQAFAGDGATPAAPGSDADTGASAQPQNAKNLDTVEVSATTSTVSNLAPTQGSAIATQPQSTVSGLYLQENVPPTGDYADAIAISPSVSSVAPNGAGLMEAQKVQMRGFQDGQYNVTFDGVPWGDSNDFTHHSTSYFTNQDTSSITVDRGPGTASTLGNATFGGTVAVQSLDPSGEFGVTPYLSYGSWNTRVEGLKLNSNPIAETGGTTAVLNVQNSNSDGYLTNAAQHRENVFGKLVQPIGEHTTLTFVGMYNEIHQFVPPGETKAQIAEYGPNYGLSSNPASQAYYQYNLDKIQTYLGYVGLHSEWDGWKLDNKLYTYAYNHFGWNGLDPNGETPNGTYLGKNDVPATAMRNWYRSWGDTFRISKAIGPGELRAGFWYDDQDNLRWLYNADATLGFAPNSKNGSLFSAYQRYMTDSLKTFEPYLEYQWNVADWMWLVGGVKYNDFSRDLSAPINQKTLKPLSYSKSWNEPLPSLAAHWTLTPNWTAYAQWAKGFLAPNLNTFYTVNPAASGSLSPEQTVNIQLGTAWNSDRLTLSADVYHIDFDNMINSRKVAGITYFYNSGGAIYKGFEAEGAYLLGDGFSVYANGSLNRATDKATNTWEPNAPHKTAALGLIYRSGPLYASLMDKFVGKSYGDTLDTQPIAGYAVANFAASYTFAQSFADVKNIKLGFQANNLLDNKRIYSLAGYTAADNTPLYYTIPARSYNVSISADFF